MIKKAAKFLNQPYPYEYRTRSVLQNATGVGLFIFLFLYIFEPFDSFSDKISPLRELVECLGYGAISFIFTFLLYYIIPRIFARHIEENKFKVKHELLLAIVLLITIGLGNAFYHYAIHPHGGLLTHILLFQYFTFVIGIFPMTGMLLISIILTLRKNLRDAQHMTDRIANMSPTEQQTQQPELVLTSENGRESLTVSPESLHYIKAAGNYVEIKHQTPGGVKTDMLRSPIKRLEGALAPYPELLRCHRAYIVNLRQIELVSGDAQGYQLHLKHLSDMVPVSRSYLEGFKAAMSNR